MRICLTAVLLTAGCLATLPLLEADDWPHWRGIDRNDMIRESSGWSPDGWLAPESAWKANAGEGSTSPLVIADQVFVMGWRDGNDVVSCLQAATGHETWSVSYNCPKYGRKATGDEGLYSGPTSSPEFDGSTGFLYTLSCDGDLNCWDTNHRGRQVWSLNLYDQYAVERRPKVGRSGLRDYGYTTAPLVQGDWVLVEIGSEKGTLAAFSKSTGKQVTVCSAKPARHSSFDTLTRDIELRGATVASSRRQRLEHFWPRKDTEQAC